MAEKILNIPLSEQDVRDLRVGDVVYLKGRIFHLPGHGTFHGEEAP